MTKPVYGRVIVKLSGEALAGSGSFGVDQAVVEAIAVDIVNAHKLGVELGIVVGGGNIFRGVEVSSRGVARPDRRHHGNAGDGDEQPGSGGRDHAQWRAGHHVFRGADADRLRSLFAPPRARPHRRGPGGAARRRHRKSVFHDRYHGGPARRRT